VEFISIVNSRDKDDRTQKMGIKEVYRKTLKSGTDLRVLPKFDYIRQPYSGQPYISHKIASFQYLTRMPEAER